MTNKNNESLSSLLDDELTQAELEAMMSELEQDEAETFGRYSLIGDVLRNEQEIVVESSFSANIQAAIADIELEPVPQEQNSDVVAITAHPKWHQRFAQKLTSFGGSNTGKGMGQLAIAASVALVAVVGVSNMAPQTGDNVPSPVISTVPLVDGIAPVSADGLKQMPTADQVTQSRINALMADHKQQLRASDADEEKESEEEKEKID